MGTPYEEYLQTDYWKALRKEAKKRVGYRCQVCNRNDRPLHTHHRTYERLGRELPNDVTVLCDVCHSLFHDKLPKPPDAQSGGE